MSVRRQPRRAFQLVLFPVSRLHHRPRFFHSKTSSPASNRKPAFPNVKASEIKAEEAIDTSVLKPYTEEEKKLLAQKYTPEQLAAIEIGESAIDLKDVVRQGRMRQDPWRLPYLDDLSKIQPIADFPVRGPVQPPDPKLRMKNDDEIAQDLLDFAEGHPDGVNAVDWLKFFNNTTTTVGDPNAEANPRSSLAAEIPNYTDDDPEVKRKRIRALARRGRPGDEEPDEGTKRMLLDTGYTLKGIRDFRVKTLVRHRVVNQTRLGKIPSIYCLAVAGNGDGMVGLGEGKSFESNDALLMARNNAIKNMKPVRRYERRTIFGDVDGKVAAAQVSLMNRPPGESNNRVVQIHPLTLSRLWSPMPALYLRDLSCSWHIRSSSAS